MCHPVSKLTGSHHRYRTLLVDHPPNDNHGRLSVCLSVEECTYLRANSLLTTVEDTSLRTQSRQPFKAHQTEPDSTRRVRSPLTMRGSCLWLSCSTLPEPFRTPGAWCGHPRDREKFFEDEGRKFFPSVLRTRGCVLG